MDVRTFPKQSWVAEDEAVPNTPYPLRRTGNLKRRTLRRVSATRRARFVDRSLAVELALSRDRRCVGLDLIPGHVCRGELVGHEGLKRSQGGDPYVADEVLIVCEWLNSDVENRPWLYRNTKLWVSQGVLYSGGRYVRRRDVSA